MSVPVYHFAVPGGEIPRPVGATKLPNCEIIIVPNQSFFPIQHNYTHSLNTDHQIRRAHSVLQDTRHYHLGLHRA
jgi:hypothetical protein